MQQFNPIDAALLFLEQPHTPMHVSMVSIYDPSTCPGKPPSYEDIVQAVQDCLPLAPSFRRRIVRVPLDLDYPYWVEDEHFELEFHMRHLALPKPGNWEQFRTQVSRLISRPLDLSRPPWEMTVIDNVDGIEGIPPGSFATVLKIHHCAIDGQAGVALINAMHQDSPRKKLKKVKDDWQPETVPDDKILLRKAWVNSIKRPATIARLVLSNARGLVESAVKELRSHEDHDEEMVVPLTRFNAPVSAHRIFDDARCTLEDLKRVRRSVEGATINDVCITIVGEAMRRYLELKGEVLKEPLVTSVPISIRTPEQVEAGGNQISVTRVSMHTDIDDLRQRLAAVSADMGAKKSVQDGVVMSTLLEVVYNLPGALVGAAARAVPLIDINSMGISNTMVTNVPGPTESIYFLGAELVRNTGSPPLLDGGGILHSVSSYNGVFLFSFTACRSNLPDPDVYRECLESAIADMVATSKPQKRSRRTGSRPKAQRKS